MLLVIRIYDNMIEAVQLMYLKKVVNYQTSNKNGSYFLKVLSIDV